MNFKKEAEKIIQFVKMARYFKTGKEKAYIRNALRIAYQKGQIDLLKEQIKEKEGK